MGIFSGLEKLGLGGIGKGELFEDPKKKQAAVYAGEIKPTVKPDIDNIVKIVLDGLNGVAFTDDKQVIEIQAQKCYVFDDEQEGVFVDVKEL